MRYLGDLGVKLDEPVLLAILTDISAPTMGEMTRSGFVEGWKSHQLVPLLPPPPIHSQPPHFNLSQPRYALQLLIHFSANDLTAQKLIVRAHRTALSQASSDLFRRTYKHTFRLALPTGQKSLPLDNATEYWRLILSPPALTWHSPPTTAVPQASPWLDWWLDYLETNWKKGVSKDMWEQMGKFVLRTMEPGGEAMGWWSEEGAWPGVIDG